MNNWELHSRSVRRTHLETFSRPQNNSKWHQLEYFDLLGFIHDEYLLGNCRKPSHYHQSSVCWHIERSELVRQPIRGRDWREFTNSRIWVCWRAGISNQSYCERSSEKYCRSRPALLLWTLALITINESHSCTFLFPSLPTKITRKRGALRKLYVWIQISLQKNRFYLESILKDKQPSSFSIIPCEVGLGDPV